MCPHDVERQGEGGSWQLYSRSGSAFDLVRGFPSLFDAARCIADIEAIRSASLTMEIKLELAPAAGNVNCLIYTYRGKRGFYLVQHSEFAPG